MTAKVIMPARQLNLDLPLAHEATEVRTTDTAAPVQVWSGAVAPLIGSGLRQRDVTSKHRRSTPATTPSTRTSTTATRTTTTSPGQALAQGSSADSNPAPFTFEALVQAYLDCRASKRNTTSALQFEQALEANLWALYSALTSGTYAIRPSICFVVTRPQPREVWAAQFTDRIVHHLLYNHIAPRFHASFAAASSACIPGRGTLYAAKRLVHHVRSVTHNGTRPAHYLKFDLANFFVAIDKDVLAAQLARKVTEPFWLGLALQILHHDPRPGVQVRSPAHLLAKVPAHKSLFNAPEHCGLPIGNLSSQFFANVYLDALDQHIKHQLRMQHYVRYVDDGVILHESPQALSAALVSINAYLPAQLHCQLHPRKCFIQPVARGIDFVGHQVTPWAHTTRRKTLRTALHRLEHMDAAEVFAAGNSYLGLVRQAHHSHADQARIAKTLQKRGHTVNGDLTKIFRRSI